MMKNKSEFNTWLVLVIIANALLIGASIIVPQVPVLIATVVSLFYSVLTIKGMYKKYKDG